MTPVTSGSPFKDGIEGRRGKKIIKIILWRE